MTLTTYTDSAKFRAERKRWLSELVPDKTFADIGGLWGTVNEKVSVAVQGGAREATMVDVCPLSHKNWQAFRERCKELGISKYRGVSADICSDRVAKQLGSFDVTHCAGVLYHAPDPIRAIGNLAAMTREWFILSCMVVPERIENRFGTVELTGGQCLLVPVLSEKQRRILGQHFDERRIKAGGLTGRSEKFVKPNGQPHNGPWWWLFSAETVIAMCEMFARVERAMMSPHGSVHVLAKPHPRAG